MSDWKEQALLLAKDGKLSWRKMAKQLGVPKSTLSDFLRKSGTQVCGVQEKVDNNYPNIILIDIETSPTLGWVWGRFDQRLNQAQIEQEQFILSWSAQRLGKKYSLVGSVITPDEVRNEDDSRLVQELAEILDQADVIIAHNGKAFDCKVIKARMCFWGIQPPSHYRIEDTLLVARSEFKFPSNRLDSLAQYLGLGEKYETGGFDLWKRCMAGDQSALDKMLEYNKQDVVLLEDVYNRLQPYNSKSVNKATFYSDDAVRCTKCGSHNLSIVDKVVSSNLAQYAQYRCNDCGGLSRSRVNGLSKSKRKTLLGN